MLTAELESELVPRIVASFQPLRIILFGSCARGDAREDRDVDLLLVLPEVEDRRQATIAIRRALAHLPVLRDVLVTTTDEIERRGDLVGTVLSPALREGQILYERKNRLTFRGSMIWTCCAI